MTSHLTVLRARVWTGEGLHEGSVHIVDGRVQRLAGADARQDEPDEQVLDADGRVVIPGMIDAHCHAYGVSFTGSPPGSMSYIAHRAADRLERALTRGFTTVRDVCGGDHGLARAVAEGYVRGPRYLYTGRALSQTGGHGDPRDPALQDGYCCDVMTEVVDGVDAVRTAVRERFRTGAHAIKLMTSGGVMSPADPLRVPQYSAAEIAAACEEAQRRSSYVAAHAYSPEAIVHSVINGVRSIEHGNLLDPPTAALMAERGAFLVPTLATYDAMARRGVALGLPAVSMAKNDEVLAFGRRAVEYATAAGVPIGFGTDLIGDMEDEQLAGLRLQHEVQGTEQLLRSVCTVNAALLGRDDLGRLTAGAVADFIVLGRDPFEQPDALWDTTPDARLVVHNGVVVSGDLLAKLRPSRN